MLGQLSYNGLSNVTDREFRQSDAAQPEHADAPPSLRDAILKDRK
jgi:hypothetical protein